MSDTAFGSGDCLLIEKLQVVRSGVIGRAKIQAAHRFDTEKTIAVCVYPKGMKRLSVECLYIPIDPGGYTASGVTKKNSVSDARHQYGVLKLFGMF